MDQSEDPRELERKIEQATRIASRIETTLRRQLPLYQRTASNLAIFLSPSSQSSRE